MPGTEASKLRWYSIEDSRSCASELTAVAENLLQDFGGLHAFWAQLLSLYEPRKISSLDARAYLQFDRGTGDPSVTYPLARSLVDTVHADIAGRQRPKPLFMTSGADWKTRRKAKKLGRFVVAQMAQRQSKYLDSWDLVQDAHVTATCIGISYVYVWGDAEEGRVRLERVPSNQILYDPFDAGETGEPNSLFRVRWIDEDELCECYVDRPLRDGDISEDEAEQRRVAIEASPGRDSAEIGHRRVCKQVRVYEAWRLPLGDRPGRHVISVSSLLLVDEEWSRDEFPFLILRWAHEREGFGGIGLVEEASSLAVELDDALQFVQEQHRLCAGRRTYVDDGVVVNEAQLEANYAETIVHITPGARIPQETNTPAVNPSSIQYLQLLRAFAHEGTGVSESGAQGRKEPGITSGVAIRTQIDLATKRFATHARDYENDYIWLARLIVAAVQDLVEQGVSVRSTFPGEEFFDDLEWSDVSLEEDLYTIQIDAVSASSDRASGRIATLEESLRSGLVSAEAFSRIMPPSGTLDIENEQGPISKQERYLASLIDKMLDADESDASFQMPAPEGLILDLPGACAQCIGAYYDARLGGVPEFNAQLLRDYIAALDRLVQSAAAAAAMAAQAGAQAGPAPMVPTAPVGPQ